MTVAPRPAAVPTPPADGAVPSRGLRNVRALPAETAPRSLRIVPWLDPVADPHGVHPCARYVELYWLPVIGPSTVLLLRRVAYGFEVHGEGFDLPLVETARALGLGDRMARNAPFRRAVERLCTFELARPAGPGSLAVRTRVPPLPLRHQARLPVGLQRSHRRWLDEQRLDGPAQQRRRAERLAAELAARGRPVEEIERQLGRWGFHPALAFAAARGGTGTGPGAA